MAGMSLLGAGAFLSGIDEMVETFDSDSGGYRLATNVQYADTQEFGSAFQDGTPHLRPGADATRAQMAQIATVAEDLDEFLKMTALRWESETKSRAPVDTGNLRASWSVSEL